MKQKKCLVCVIKSFVSVEQERIWDISICRAFLVRVISVNWEKTDIRSKTDQIGSWKTIEMNAIYLQERYNKSFVLKVKADESVQSRIPHARRHVCFMIHSTIGYGLRNKHLA